MKARLVSLVLAVTLGVAAWTFLHRPGQPSAPSWQGWIEGDFLFLGADEAGRVTKLAVSEGAHVEAGSALFEIESKIQDAEWNEAAAALAEAQARLARAEAAQQRPEEIAVLEAQKARAEAAIQQSKPELERARDLVSKGYSPVSRLDAATAAYNRDLATLAEIERQIGVAKLNARSEDIEAARTVVAQAQSRLASAETRRSQRHASAPVSGRIQEVFYREGEVVPAGRPIVSLLPPDNIKVRFFVPQAVLPRLATGTLVLIQCDGCGKDLAAEVTFLSTEVEFTPPVIFSLEERQKLVFRVEARPKEPARLRVGQPVTVTLAPEHSEAVSHAGS